MGALMNSMPQVVYPLSLRSKHGLLAKQGNFACLEDDGSRNVNGQYECQQTPVASNNKATSKHQHKRPGSKVNLWDDD
ncbi:hypothetical protein F441_01702, partial [Phytophthora nicotianae CJ01A1]